LTEEEALNKSLQEQLRKIITMEKQSIDTLSTLQSEKKLFEATLKDSKEQIKEKEKEIEVVG
tara:strand:- start:961 stop:1146 length:186 start_codon:yes stop_codon:yes gene_type:complete